MKVGISYHPEQFAAEDWESDLQAGRNWGLNVLRCGATAWSAFAPNDATWDSRWAMAFLDQAQRHDYDVIWCTPSAIPPFYLFDRWPNLGAVTSPGLAPDPGGYRPCCPSHPGFHDLCMVMAERLARELAGHPAVKGWQVIADGAGSGIRCRCERCQRSFQEWLRKRYRSLDELNRLWQPRGLSQAYTNWTQIALPAKSAPALTPALELACRRFHAELGLNCYRQQYEALKRGGAQRVTATSSLHSRANLLNPWTWRPWLEAVAAGCDLDDLVASRFQLALLQGATRDSRPLWILEEEAGQECDDDLYPDHLARLALHLRIDAAAGAEYAIYGQLRQPTSGNECERGAVLRHDGRPTRLARAMQNAIQAVPASAPAAAIPDDLLLVFSFEQQWANETHPQPGARWDYRAEIEQHWFAAVCDLREAGVKVGAPDQIQSRFSLILAPYLHMVEPGLTQAVFRALAAGATVVTTVDFCRLDQNGTILRNPPLAEAGYWTAVPDLEILALQPDFRVPGNLSGAAVSGRIFWAVPAGAEVAGLGWLEHGGQSGPVALDFRIGKGRLIVLLTALDRTGVRELLKLLC